MGVEGAEWENLEMNDEVNVRSPVGGTRANILWKMSEGKGRGDEWQKIMNRNTKRLQSPVMALAEALRRVGRS